MNDDRSNASRHYSILTRLAETYAKKNADYGDSFSKSIDRRGYVAALTRMDDKMERLDQLLINGHAANYESALDSALDLANYAIMLAMYLEAHK